MGGMKILAAICAASCTAFAVAREVPVEPSADFEKTFARVRKEMKAGEPIEFVFEDGIHVLRSCIVLKPSDTGIVFRARHPGKAVLVGGVSLKGSDFKPVSAANAPKGLPETARGKVRAWNVPTDLCKSLGRIWDGEPILLVDLGLRPMARWPNDGYVRIPGSGAGKNANHLMLFDKRMGTWCDGVVSRLKKAKDICGGEGVLGLDDESPAEDETLEEKLADNERPGNALGFFGMTGAYESNGECGYFTSELGMPTIKFNNRPGAGSSVYFYGMMEELDEPGEWCYDRIGHRLVVWPDERLTDASSVLVATRTDGFIRFDGASEVVVEGLTFAALARGSVALDLGRSERCRIEGCQFVGLGGRVIDIRGRFNRVQSCDFVDICDNCIRLSGGDPVTQTPGSNVVDNCFFERPCAKRRGCSEGAISMDGVDNVVSHCLIRNVREHAMNWGGYGCVVEYCRMYDANTEFRDSGVAYVAGYPMSYGCQFRYNDISGSPGQSHGIYPDDCTSGHLIYGNVVRNVGWGAIFLGGGRDNVISNNVVLHFGSMGLHNDNRGLFWPAWEGNVGHFREKVVPMLGLDKSGSAVARRFPKLAKWEKDGKLVYGNVDNEWVNNVVIDGQQTQDQVCLDKFIPLDRQVSRGNLGIGLARKPANGVWRFGGFKLVDATESRDRVFHRLPKWKNVPNKKGFDFFVYDKGDFNLAEDSIIPKECPGFVPIPWDKIGLYKDKWRAVLPEETCQLK